MLAASGLCVCTAYAARACSSVTAKKIEEIVWLLNAASRCCRYRCLNAVGDRGCPVREQKWNSRPEEKEHCHPLLLRGVKPAWGALLLLDCVPERRPVRILRVQGTLPERDVCCLSCQAAWVIEERCQVG